MGNILLKWYACVMFLWLEQSRKEVFVQMNECAGYAKRNNVIWESRRSEALQIDVSARKQGFVWRVLMMCEFDEIVAEILENAHRLEYSCSHVSRGQEWTRSCMHTLRRETEPPYLFFRGDTRDTCWLLWWWMVWILSRIIAPEHTSNGLFFVRTWRYALWKSR